MDVKAPLMRTFDGFGPTSVCTLDSNNFGRTCSFGKACMHQHVGGGRFWKVDGGFWAGLNHQVAIVREVVEGLSQQLGKLCRFMCSH